MPVLGLGTWQLTGEACSHAVRMGLRDGYRHLDTARMYENEEEVGRGLAHAGVPREEVFLTTKLQMGKLDPAGIRESCERSLQGLRVDYVDLLLIHWPEEGMSLGDSLGAMAELRAEGKIRHIGVSNFTVEHLEAADQAAERPIFCHQIEFHPYIDQDPVRAWCRERDVAVTAYCPLARGRAAKDERLADVGRKYGKSAAQVALRWIIEQPGVAAIPKSSTEDHLRENLRIFDFELTEDDHALIAGLERDRRIIDPEWAPEWDT